MRELILKQIRDGTLCHGMTPIQTEDIQAPEGIDVIAAGLGDGPECPMYGKLMLYIECHGKFYRCCYHVHRPHQPPILANHMEYAYELVRKSYGYVTYTDKPFGLKAFWARTPDNCLTGDDLLMRRLMRALKRYSVDHKLCARLRKTDRQFLARQDDLDL